MLGGNVATNAITVPNAPKKTPKNHSQVAFASDSEGVVVGHNYPMASNKDR